MIHRIALIVSLFCLSFLANAQEHSTPADTATPAYIKHPELPAFKLRMMDSVTIFNTYNIKKGKYTMLFLFGADCTHCKQTTDSLVRNMDKFKDVQIYMFTFSGFPELRKFADSFKLKNYKNIVVGQDGEFFFPSFYKIQSVPGIAIYDKNKKFVTIFKGSAKIEDLAAAVKED